ncbi:hypothetical protein Tco_1093202 [Tanacetum coccineum]|uniref:Xylulose kinase-1 n=1 Tax=Tanacetum coccineum TaxID=301880 RepID=A0ABQ5IDA6_9ASTR
MRLSSPLAIIHNVLACDTEYYNKKAPSKGDRSKGIEILSDVALSEAAQLKEATKRSKKDFHISQAYGSGDGTDLDSGVPDEQQHKTSGTDEGTSTKLGVPDVPTYDSESENESWGDSEDDNDDDSKGEDIYSMAGEDEFHDDNPPPPPPVTPTQQAPHTLSTIKLLILKKDTNGQIRVLPPKTAEEILARERERKARTTLLMSIPENHLAKCHKMNDAKEMWEAIKSRFGGNDESKKMQKYILKQQFESFSVSPLKMPIRSFLGLYLLPGPKVFESDVKGSTASSSSTQNVAFVSSESTKLMIIDLVVSIIWLSNLSSSTLHSSFSHRAILPWESQNNAYKSSQGHLSSRHGLTLKKFKKDAPCQAFKNQERHRLKGESSPLQRLKSESSPSPLLVSTCRNQQHLGRAFTMILCEEKYSRSNPEINCWIKSSTHDLSPGYI